MWQSWDFFSIFQLTSLLPIFFFFSFLSLFLPLLPILFIKKKKFMALLVPVLPHHKARIEARKLKLIFYISSTDGLRRHYLRDENISTKTTFSPLISSPPKGKWKIKHKKKWEKNRRGNIFSSFVWPNRRWLHSSRRRWPQRLMSTKKQVECLRFDRHVINTLNLLHPHVLLINWTNHKIIDPPPLKKIKPTT